MGSVAVLDVGKTKIKLSALTRDGVFLEILSVDNLPRPGPPYRHLDAAAIENWCLDNLRALVASHGVETLVSTGHGSAGALVSDDQLLLAPIDYDSEAPDEIHAAYRRIAGPLHERGSSILAGTAHMARQMLYLETAWPAEFARARWFLGGPQFWAWRFSGVAASELTYLGAQSHVFDVRKHRWAAIVAERGWQRLMAPITPAWQTLGTLRPQLAKRHGLPATIGILCGIHDSSANFYRYQQAGLADLALISTGTWIVGLADIPRPDEFTVTAQRICNADVSGNPVAGVLALGGREFAIIAGDAPDTPVESGRLAALVAAGTMALPSFAEDDVLFPGTAGKGRIVGPPPATPADRRALAVLYAALVTDVCLDVMGTSALTVLDGSFVKDPLFAALVAALRPGRRTMFGSDAYGTAAGAALLAAHATRTAPVAVDIAAPDVLNLSGLAAYREEWRQRSEPAGIAVTDQKRAS